MAQNQLNFTLLRRSVTSLRDTITRIPFPPPGGFGLGTLDVVRGPGSIGFKLNGTLIWLIDVRRFAGTPTLTLDNPQPHTTRVRLENARFPGTQLSADFVCEIGATGLFGTPMDITFTLGGFHGYVTMERWLVGTQALESTITVGSDVCPLGVTSKLAIAGQAQARFYPSWIMTMNGSAIATLSGLGSDLVSDTFAFKLLFPTEPSVSIYPKSRRTLLGIFAGTHTWQLKPQVISLPIGTLAAADGLFAEIFIECGEGTVGDTARELLALSDSTNGLTLSVVGGMTDLDGKPFALTLAGPVYAIAFDPTSNHSQGDQTFLTSHFGSSPVWFAVDGFVLQVGDVGLVSGVPPFEVDTLKGQITAFHCTPALLNVAAPLTGYAGETVAAKPLPLVAGTVLPFVTAPGPVPGWGIIAGPEVSGQRRISLPNFAVSVLRREDLLSLDFLFYNLALEAGGGNVPEVIIKDATQPAYFVAQFNAPQNIAEQAFLETYSDPPHHVSPPGSTSQNLTEEVPGPDPSQTLAAGPSRLAFQFPVGVTSILYSLDSLLDWVKLQQSVVPVALPDQSASLHIASTAAIDVVGGIHFPLPIKIPPFIREPLATETAIEAPWHLFLSPNSSGAWAHSKSAVTLSERTELWHTRLAVRNAQNTMPEVDENAPRKIRAIWSQDYHPSGIPAHADTPFRMSLDPNDRDQIVRLSADFTIPHYEPQSITAEKLFLSSLGAWLEVFGNWGDPLPFVRDDVFSVEQWQHRAVLARDNYVRVVYAGYLLPFGHHASLVKVTERQFQAIGGGHTKAYLRQYFFLIVRETLKTYSSYLNVVQQRGFPYQNMGITTLVTPALDAPGIDDFGRYSFFPTVNTDYFQFHLVGQDAEQQAQQASEFLAPLYFVERGGDYANAVERYNGSQFIQRTLSGQKVAYAPSKTVGDTTLHTTTMTFSANPPQPDEGSDNPFYPQMIGADVVVPAIQQVTGQPGATSVTLYSQYIAGGFGPGEVFVQSASNMSVSFSGKQSGGVATPNLSVSGLSRKFGTVSGTTPDNVNAGTFNPVDIFQDSDAKLFGVVPLSALVDAIGGDLTTPVLITDRTSSEIRTHLDWTPVLQNYALGPITLTFDDVKTALNIQVDIVTSLSGGAPQTSIQGSLQNFTLSLAKVVGLIFDNLSFSAPAGQKLDVSASIRGGGLQFLGDLSFLNTLEQYIPSNGFEDPPSLDVTPEGITAGYSLAIPSIGVGIFSLENIALSAALTLPFFPPTPLRFRFAFSERDHPFLLTVSLLGGGGFFGITVGPDGVEILEASLEFGANVSIDVVVASGNVHIMAGVYLKIDPSENASQLTGYLRAGGSLDVLGLISASIEFYLGFTYFWGPPCKIAGEATVTIEVHVLFFSASVSASLRREFSDPKISFADLIGPTDWTYYCDSFAA